jgi:hypothetical protein
MELEPEPEPKLMETSLWEGMLSIVGTPENAWTPQQEHQGPSNVGILIAGRSSTAIGKVATSVVDPEPEGSIFIVRYFVVIHARWWWWARRRRGNVTTHSREVRRLRICCIARITINTKNVPLLLTNKLCFFLICFFPISKYKPSRWMSPSYRVITINATNHGDGVLLFLL